MTAWQKKDWRGNNMWKSAPTGSSSLIQPAAGLHRGTGAMRNMKAEDALRLSADPSPYHWTLKSALTFSLAVLSWATRKNRAMIPVQNSGDAETIRKKPTSKSPKSFLNLLILRYPGINSNPDSEKNLYFSPFKPWSVLLVILCHANILQGNIHN